MPPRSRVAIMPFLALALVLLGALAVGLAAAPARAATLEACDLITQDQAAKVLGEPVEPPRRKKVTGLAQGLSCTWFTAAPAAQRGGKGSLKVTVYTAETMAGGMFEEPAGFLHRLIRTKIKRVPLEKIDGMGQEAWWEPGANVLHILNNGVYCAIKVEDLAKLSAPNRQELDKKVAAHRRELALAAAKDYVLPKLKP